MYEQIKKEIQRQKESLYKPIRKYREPCFRCTLNFYYHMFNYMQGQLVYLYDKDIYMKNGKVEVIL